MVEIKSEPHENDGRGGGSVSPAGNRKRPYPDEQLNDVKWLRRVWAKARDQERCANERAAMLREEIKAAKEQIMAADTAAMEQAGAQATLRQDLATSKDQIQAADTAATEQAEAAGKGMSALQKTVLALEKRAEAAEAGKRRSEQKSMSIKYAAKEHIQAAAAAAKEHAEAADTLGKDLARTCEELVASRAQLAAANEGAKRKSSLLTTYWSESR